MKTITINKNDADQRVDKFITKSFPDMPQSIMYKGIRKKRIKLNGKRCDISDRLCEGDILELYINDEFLAEKRSTLKDFTKITPTLNLIYEDDNILLVNKLPGVSVHDDETSDGDDLITNIKAYLYLKGEYDPKNESSFSPSLCNRIDKNTGGIVIAAKNASALRAMNKKIKDREITKKYLCIVHGKLFPKEKTLNAYLLKNSSMNKAFVFDSPDSGGKEISTHYKVLKTKKGLTLAEITLLTGRTHQIRAHMAHIGHPLAGDTKYGTNEMNKGLPYKYQALYSYKLRFDFTTSSFLNYLKGKEFSVQINDIDFARDF